MNTKKKALVSLCLVAACLLAVSSISAFVLLSPERTWDSAPTYIVDDRGLSSVNDGDGGATRVAQAVTTWNSAGAGTVVHAQKGSVAGYSLGDGVPMLNFRDPINACKGNCLAATFTGFFSERNDGTFRIEDADIVTNTRFSWTSEGEDPNGNGCSSEFYIEGVMVHEIGHGLGLGHSNVSGSTMFPSVSSCNNGPASLANDDEDGIQALYAGGGGSGGGSCTLLPKGASCTSDSQCCSNKCKGGANKTCK